MVSRDHKLSVRRQCRLLTLTRSNLYYEPKGESAENLRFMEIIDKQFLETPWYGSRQMARWMKRQGHKCGRHRVRRLMRLMRFPHLLAPLLTKTNSKISYHIHNVKSFSFLRACACCRAGEQAPWDCTCKFPDFPCPRAHGYAIMKDDSQNIS